MTLDFKNDVAVFGESVKINNKIRVLCYSSITIWNCPE